ncbi:hypothetical protein D3C72_2431940 [compost metagenome]
MLQLALALKLLVFHRLMRELPLQLHLHDATITQRILHPMIYLYKLLKRLQTGLIEAHLLQHQ